MTNTTHLGMPFIEGSQAQKHVTHNEALRILDAAIQIGVLDADQASPPPAPVEGDRHIVASGATGAWAGQAGAVAAYEDGAWRFLTPKPGWCAWSDADGALLVYDGAAWTDVASGGGGAMPDSVSLLGINDTASDPNLLTVKSNAALFNAIAVADGGTGDMRVQIAKEGSAGTASVVFSDAFSGRAEFGLVGSDAFKLKVSNDGTTFVEALVVDQDTGNASLPRGVALTGVIAPPQITSNQNDYNPAGVASASVLNLSSDALRSVSGLAGGAEGRVVAVVNTGSQIVSLLNESASSTAANRFALGTDIAIIAKQAALLRYDGAASRWRALARPGGRETLTANRTYYVRTDGSDSNDGLSNASGGAFLTVQKAVNVVAALDIATYNVTIQVADGTYTGAITVNGAWLGSGTVTIVGNTATPANVIFSTTSADAVAVANGGRITVSGMELRTTTAGSCLHALTGGAITVGASLRFGAAANYHMYVEANGTLRVAASYTISGSAGVHWTALANGIIQAQGNTVALSGTPAFSSGFAFAGRASLIECYGMSFSGSATGARYISAENSLIFTNAGGASYLPGSVAGSTSNGGLYI
jgi:hypothetical protein